VQWRPPQVADVVRLLGAARYSPSQNVETVLDDIRRVAEKVCVDFPGLRIDVQDATDLTGFPNFPPFEVNRSAPVVAAVNRAFKEIRSADQPTGAPRPYCFYGTDAAHLQHGAGMEGVVCGPGGRYNTMPDERVDIDDYLDAIRVYLLTMHDLCNRVPQLQ
jgi:acetylornithine deacetylase